MCRVVLGVVLITLLCCGAVRKMRYTAPRGSVNLGPRPLLSPRGFYLINRLRGHSSNSCLQVMGPRFALGSLAFAALIFILLVDPALAMQGVRTDHLKILSGIGRWVTSASHDVWNHIAEYDVWRMEMLSMLQTLRIFDVLLDDLDSPALRVISGIGLACGATIALAPIANAARKSLQEGEESKASSDERLPTIADVKLLFVFQLVARSILPGLIR